MPWRRNAQLVSRVIPSLIKERFENIVQPWLRYLELVRRFLPPLTMA